MELLFLTDELQRLAESPAGCARLTGGRDGAALAQRFNELAAAENLATILALPALALQRPGKDGRFSIRVAGIQRLKLQAVDWSGENLAEITCVRVTGIEGA